MQAKNRILADIPDEFHPQNHTAKLQFYLHSHQILNIDRDSI